MFHSHYNKEERALRQKPSFEHANKVLPTNEYLIVDKELVLGLEEEEKKGD